MADWTLIPDASIEPGKPVRSIDGLALRDNPVAIAEGAVGAPRVVGKGAMRLDDYPVLAVTASDAQRAEQGFIPYTPGFFSQTSNVNAVALTAVAKLFTGSFRLRVTQHATGFATQQNSETREIFINPSSSTLRIRKNGAVVASWVCFTYQGPVARVVDIAVVPGDTIVVEHHADFIAPSVLSNITLSASDAYVTRPLYLRASENNLP